ncbi:class I SAM-dependent methyltransferase [Novosphingobium sp. RD2P27]|uniref:Class I SAM-dependent methyltransferase n=1 Tax=Novosphingobium kalidii TaxID=3230299 RepID=A0ABV2CZF9_9SPHN
MTSRELTPLLSIAPEATQNKTLREQLFQVAFSLVQWPWLLRSLHGGSRASKDALLNRLDLGAGALPHLGSWKADTYLLHRIVDLIEENKPRVIVELGCGATTLVLAKALALTGSGGKLYSYDQNASFVAEVEAWLATYRLPVRLQHAPLTFRACDWPGQWYQIDEPPEEIDLLVIDGPPWAIHPFVRGAAEVLFSRLSSTGVIVLDDAARPGERYIARRWKQRWPDIAFQYEGGGAKGTLIGRKREQTNSAARSEIPNRLAAE